MSIVSQALTRVPRRYLNPHRGIPFPYFAEYSVNQWEQLWSGWLAIELRTFTWKEFLNGCYRYDPVDVIVWRQEYDRRTLLRPAAATQPGVAYLLRPSATKGVMNANP